MGPFQCQFSPVYIYPLLYAQFQYYLPFSILKSKWLLFNRFPHKIMYVFLAFYHTMYMLRLWYCQHFGRNMQMTVSCIICNPLHSPCSFFFIFGTCNLHVLLRVRNRFMAIEEMYLKSKVEVFFHKSNSSVMK